MGGRNEGIETSPYVRWLPSQDLEQDIPYLEGFIDT